MGTQIDMLVEGGRVVSEGRVRAATVAIGDGKIVGLLSPELQVSRGTPRRIDASGKIVMPGIIDAHIHFGMFTAHVDDFTSATTAAAHGGVTSVIIYAMGRAGMPVSEFLQYLARGGGIAVGGGLRHALSPGGPRAREYQTAQRGVRRPA